MWRWSSLLVLLLLFGLSEADQKKDRRPGGERYFFTNGKPFAKVAGKTREPKVIIDTVNVVGGQGVALLNREFNRERHSVRATSNLDMFPTATGILETAGGTVYSYSCYVSKTGDSIIVKSSGGAADTSKVSLQIILK